MKPVEIRHRDLSRQKILDQARKIFTKQGLAGLSMRALAKALGCSAGAIYKHFTNKEEILQALRQESWALANTRNGIPPAGLTAQEMLLESARGYLRFAAEYPEHYQLMFHAEDLPYGTPDEIRSHPQFAPVIAMVEQGVRGGGIVLPAGYDPAMLAFQMWITVHGAAMLHMSIMKSYGGEFDIFFDELLVAMIGMLTSPPK
jgi:AcrR family transcriptional regulator